MDCGSCGNKTIKPNKVTIVDVKKGLRDERTLDFNNHRPRRLLLDSGALEGECLGRCPGDGVRCCGIHWRCCTGSL